jgi:hypothetical protein
MRSGSDPRSAARFIAYGYVVTKRRMTSMQTEQSNYEAVRAIALTKTWG